MQIVMPPDVLRASIRVLRVGDRLSQDELLRWVTDHGYEATPLVQEPGQVARRGSILDLFPPGADVPVRIDFFGDEIDAIRSFDPHTQRSHDRLREIRLLPPAELPLDRLRRRRRRAARVESRWTASGGPRRVGADHRDAGVWTDASFSGPLRAIPRRSADDACGLSQRGQPRHRRRAIRGRAGRVATGAASTRAARCLRRQRRAAGGTSQPDRALVACPSVAGRSSRPVAWRAR